MASNPKKRLILTGLLFVNVIVFLWHIVLHCVPPYQSYFSQLTIIGQTFVIINFILALKHFNSHKFSKMHSRFFILTFSIETVAVLGFWALRIFFTEGILNPDEERSMLVEALSLWLHGGSFLTLLWIGRLGKVQLEFGFRKKLVLHLFWGIPYILVQWFHYKVIQKHIYGFLELFDWNILAAFELLLYFLSIASDYFLSFAIEHKEHLIHQESEKRKAAHEQTLTAPKKKVSVKEH